MVPFAVSPYEGGRDEVRLRGHDEVAVGGRVDLPLPHQRVQGVPEDFLARGGDT